MRKYLICFALLCCMCNLVYAQDIVAIATLEKVKPPYLVATTRRETNNYPTNIAYSYDVSSAAKKMARMIYITTRVASIDSLDDQVKERLKKEYDNEYNLCSTDVEIEAKGVLWKKYNDTVYSVEKSFMAEALADDKVHDSIDITPPGGIGKWILPLGTAYHARITSGKGNYNISRPVVEGQNAKVPFDLTVSRSRELVLHADCEGTLQVSFNLSQEFKEKQVAEDIKVIMRRVDVAAVKYYNEVLMKDEKLKNEINKEIEKKINMMFLSTPPGIELYF